MVDVFAVSKAGITTRAIFFHANEIEMSEFHPLQESRKYGSIGITNGGPDGFAVGGFSNQREGSAAAVRRFSDPDAVVPVAMARWIAREFHDWDI